MLKWMKSLLSFRSGRPKDFLIVGLGNPGMAYEKTRHNVGFRAVKFFAKRHSIAFKKAQRLSAEIGTGHVGASSVSAMLPLTYMNSSGEAVLEAVKAFKLPAHRITVVVDDIALPVGAIRFKEEGSSGGHNGLKSIEEHLGTKNFPRLRIGVGHPQEKNLADFVLSPFDQDDETKLPEVFNQVADVLDCWILEGSPMAMTRANTKKVNRSH